MAPKSYPPANSALTRSMVKSRRAAAAHAQRMAGIYKKYRGATKPPKRKSPFKRLFG